jgi:DNA mismatch repair protein MutS
MNYSPTVVESENEVSSDHAESIFPEFTDEVEEHERAVAGQTIGSFHSILFLNTAYRVPDQGPATPDFFVDLNLDQIIAAITAGKEEYNLKPFFYISLHDVGAINFRHEIMQDLEDAQFLAKIKAFAETMHTMREHLAQVDKLYYTRQKERWFLDAVNIYCDAVNRLCYDLSLAEFSSRGLLAFREYVSQYAASERFTSLREQTRKLTSDLTSIHYCVFIKGLHVEVRKYEGESDYSAEVEATFERFKQGAAELTPVIRPELG